MLCELGCARGNRLIGRYEHDSKGSPLISSQLIDYDTHKPSIEGIETPSSLYGHILCSTYLPKYLSCCSWLDVTVAWAWLDLAQPQARLSSPC